MSILLPGTIGDTHPSAQNKWIIPGSKWFDVDVMALNQALKDMYKNYKNWIHRAKQQGNYAKENFTYTKMKDKFENILDELNIKAAPKRSNLNLPKLNLPNLKKPSKTELPKLKLPKLKTV